MTSGFYEQPPARARVRFTGHIVTAMANGASGRDKISGEQRLAPVGDDAVRRRQTRGAALPRVTHGASKPLRRMLLKVATDVGFEWFRGAFEAGTGGRDVASRTAVDASYGIDDELLHLGAPAACRRDLGARPFQRRVKFRQPLARGVEVGPQGPIATARFVAGGRDLVPLPRKVIDLESQRFQTWL